MRLKTIEKKMGDTMRHTENASELHWTLYSCVHSGYLPERAKIQIHTICRWQRWFDFNKSVLIATNRFCSSVFFAFNWLLWNWASEFTIHLENLVFSLLLQYIYYIIFCFVSFWWAAVKIVFVRNEKGYERICFK